MFCLFDENSFTNGVLGHCDNGSQEKQLFDFNKLYDIYPASGYIVLKLGDLGGYL